MNQQLSRRQFLAASSGVTLSMLGAPGLGTPGLGAPGLALADPPARRVRVACIYTVLRFRSHAFNILESFLNPYMFNGKVTQSGVDVVSFYADQRVPEIDLTDQISRQRKIPVFKTIGDALTLGGKNLAVDAVLSIGEHGEYPMNKLGQKEYPRKRFFDEIVAVMRRSNRFVPIFNDKHLSYRWDWAKEMYDTARRHRIPLQAGSSVPLATRRPNISPCTGASVEEAVAIHGGGIETYDFHGFEVLQSHVEARKGGETGIERVEFVTGDALWQAFQKGRISMDLVQASLRREFGRNIDLRKGIPGEKSAPHALLLTYKDGLKGTVLKVGANSTRWQFACKLAGDKNLHATRYYVGPWGNRNLFMGLSNAILHLFKTRQQPYAVERTLLAGGVLDAAMHSRAQRGRPLATPQLEFNYAPIDFTRFRELGATWRTLEKVEQPKTMGPIGRTNK